MPVYFTSWQIINHLSIKYVVLIPSFDLPRDPSCLNQKYEKKTINDPDKKYWILKYWNIEFNHIIEEFLQRDKSSSDKDPLSSNNLIIVESVRRYVHSQKHILCMISNLSKYYIAVTW